jgi:type VI secretion system secreted protein VgrG
MSKIIQRNRAAAIATPLGEDVLVLRSLHGREELARLSGFDLELLSEDASIKFDDIIGKNVTIRLNLIGGAVRYWNGFVSQFSQMAPMNRYPRYRAVVVPWLWFLTRSADCKISQKKTVPQIIEDVFKKHGCDDYQLKLTGSYEPREYCVQYRESAFDYVSRLMEEEGIYYFFTHENGKHTLVLADAPSTHKPFAGYAEIGFRPPDPTSKSGEHIREWTINKEVLSGKYAHTDYNFEMPRTDLEARSEIPRDHAKSNLEKFDYPGEYQKYSLGNRYARVRIEEIQATHEMLLGQADARGICVGYRFKLEDHPRQDQNREYVVSSTTVNIQEDVFEAMAAAGVGQQVFQCSFTAMDATTQFRPARTTPRPIVKGPQTAVVVGPKGEEIYTDKYGRVKVHFHWDRYDKQDENSSCWIRVAHSWAGKRWGAIHIPRLGQEVVVDFLEGDPDQPLITGSVYNDEQKVPYDLPGEMTKSTLKSNSTKGGVGFNEIRLEDKKDQEQIFIHAERNLDVRVKNDAMERVIHDRHLIVGAEKDGKKSGDQNEMVYRDKHLKVHRNQVEHIGGDIQLFVGGVDDGKGNQDVVLKGTKKELIEKDDHRHVKGKRNEKVDGDQSLTVGGKQQEKVATSHALDAGQEIHLKAGMKVIIEAGMQLTLKGPGGFVDIGPAGVTIQGTMVLINSGGAAGAGSGSKPTAPEDAKEAKPTGPTQADDAPSGQKSARG